MLGAEKDAYEQSEAILLTLVFSNCTARAVTVFGPFMLRNLGVCGILSVDHYWSANAPAELAMTDSTTAKDYESPREIAIGPNEVRTLRRVLVIPHGNRSITKDGKSIIDENGKWSKGKHRIRYSYTCSLYRPKDSVAQDPFTVLGINDPSRYWQGNLKSQTIEVLVK